MILDFDFLFEKFIQLCMVVCSLFLFYFIFCLYDASNKSKFEIKCMDNKIHIIKDNKALMYLKDDNNYIRCEE